MLKIVLPLCAVAVLAACSGNPIGGNNDKPPVDDDTGIDSDRVLPPGTTSPTRNRRIVRREARTDGGDGFATDIAYDATNDRFSVRNLGFDGDNSYSRGVSVGSIGPYAVYESAMTYQDSVTGTPIDQFLHRAIYGVSRSGQTEFAIVRTGSYLPYGFGGFVYQRNGAVTLPTAGQARFDGAYSALRDFEGAGGIEYAAGDMTVAIDFRDFIGSNAVQGEVRNRAIYDVAGNDITSDVIAALNTKNSSALTALPVLLFKVGPGVMDANGEIVGDIASTAPVRGSAQVFETGKYYAIVSGTEPDEMVGMIVVTADDPRADSVKVRETGGFILYRRP